jgi:hypothetical protein
VGRVNSEPQARGFRAEKKSKFPSFAEGRVSRKFRSMKEDP